MVGGSHHLHPFIAPAAAHYFDLLLLDWCLASLFSFDGLLAGRFASVLGKSVVGITIGLLLSVSDCLLHPLLLVCLLVHLFLLGIASFILWSLLISELFDSGSILHQVQNSINTLSLLQLIRKLD